MIRDPVSQMGQSNKKSKKKVSRSQARKEAAAKKKAKKTIVTSSMQVPQKILVIHPHPQPSVQMDFARTFQTNVKCSNIDRV